MLAFLVSLASGVNGQIAILFCLMLTLSSPCPVLDLAITHPLLLFFCPIVLDIVIVLHNAKCQPKEQGEHDCPQRLENSPGQPHHEEWNKIIIVPPALPPMVPSATARSKKKRKKAPALVAPAAVSNNASTAMPTLSTAPTTKKGKQLARRKPLSLSTFAQCQCGQR